MRIYADGVFDLFHYGHGNIFFQIRQLYPEAVIIAGVHNDETTLKYKGPSVMSEEERIRSVSYCKFVDIVLPNAPWVIDEEFLKTHNIDLVAHDETPYPSVVNGIKVEDTYGYLKKTNRFLPVKYTDTISTSDLIGRILINHELFKERNKARNKPY
jgi:cytidyltransferase-like protein